MGSLAELSQSLRTARQEHGLTPADAATAAGIETSEVMALESGEADRLFNRIETLRAVRAYADSLGFSGGEYVVAVMDLWPAPEHIAARAPDIAATPVVSVSGATAGTWAVERTGVPDATITGVFTPVVALSAYDTGTIPAVQTGETPRIGEPSLMLLKVAVAVTAVLVVLGSVALAEHSHVTGWYDGVQRTTSRVFHDAFGSGAPSTPATVTARHTPPKRPLPKVTMVESPATSSVAVSVRATSFTVKVVAYGYPCWVQATDPVHHTTVFAQTLQSGQSHIFTISSPLSVETASAAGRAYLYDGTRFIGYYFPTRTPFYLNFRTTL
ncbi:MAG TPA: helix-turn-helix transcriptional regulator [Acidimicrobiales bacterium]|nr:helix-turn-helix transcriptional regulator [Acidimicrobiales bacterium]